MSIPADTRIAFYKQLPEFFMALELIKEGDAQSDLIAENAMLGGHSAGFWFAGECISPLHAKARQGLSITPLSPSLETKGHALMALKRNNHTTMEKIRMSLTTVLIDCATRQDIRDALPEPLVQSFYQLSELPRTRPEGFHLVGQSPRRRQFDHLCDIVHSISGCRLLT